ncbi:MAG: glycosyl transferase, partial [Bacteroidota bacterium]
MTPTTHFAFTICSNNYLGQALALKRSFLKHNPHFGFYIVLVDKRSDEVDYSLFEPATILTVAEVEGVDIDDLIARYYIIELNTSVKPSVFKHLIKHNPQAEAIYYLDPDLYFYGSLAETDELLQTRTAVLTPHILSPIPRDQHQPDENTFLRFGIYNLGFLGINAKSEETKKMLDWWEERNLKLGYDRPHKGYFVDQLWMVYAPLFYSNIHILDTFNYNMAPWNLHERSVKEVNGNTILLNDGSHLVFYHYSKISPNETDVSREYDRFTLK